MTLISVLNLTLYHFQDQHFKDLVTFPQNLKIFLTPFFFSLYCSCFVRSHQTCKDDTCDRTWFQMSVSPYHLQKLQIVFLLFFTPFLGWLCSSYAIHLRGKWKCRHLSEKERKAQLENSSVVTQIIHFTSYEKQHACLAFLVHSAVGCSMLETVGFKHKSFKSNIT